MRILVVDDEQTQRDSLAGYLKKQGHEVATAESAQTALAHLYHHPAHLVLSDYKMPYMTGADLLSEVKSRHPETVVILLTAFGTVEIAVEAMKSGAWDFLGKPVDLDVLDGLIGSVQTFLDGQQRQHATHESSLDTLAFQTRDPATRDVLQKALKIAPATASVLITGETGVGKDVLAQTIHENSTRRTESMITVNCAALPSQLIESELFGHVKGAFTGAVGNRIGRFEEADGSTLFLDEIGDLPLDMQVKLLRFLQSGEFQRIGEGALRKSDVRIIAATNVDLEHAMNLGEFREDLYYRLNVVSLHIPPLRERREDIPFLAERFLAEFADQNQRSGLTLQATALDKLMNYAWPGNVREMRNILESATLFAEGSTIRGRDLNLRASPKPEMGKGSLPDSIENMERQLISEALKKAEGNQSACARKLGISERVLRYKLQKYNLK